jgi:DNA-binding CsgD family transcriptional regulator
MAALGILGPQKVQWFELEGDRVTVGREDHNDVVITDDDLVSRDHAVLERFGVRWFVRDLDSMNGVSVNDVPLTEQRALHNNDEILLGRTKCLFRDRVDQAGLPPTRKKAQCPDLTRREREVLLELCRAYFVPVGDDLPAPASRRELADRLFVTEAAVQAHLARLYDKFGVFDRSTNRRRQLASEAIHRNCVTQRDYASDNDEE